MLGSGNGRLRFLSHAVMLVIAALLLSTEAKAYPWMIRHHYTACGGCHYDPSGAGAITRYGRSVADTAMRTQYGDEASASSEELPKSAQFLFGLVPQPEWLDLGGDVRLMELRRKSEGVPLSDRAIWMQLDAEATVNLSGFVASGTLGYAPEGALGAALTRGTEQNLVSRQHWVGYRPDSNAWMVRLGRMNLPFGIRTIEHTLQVRMLSRTNINDQQQFGASFALSLGQWRGELMAIAGNFQLRPDDYRERGYSAFLEWAPVDTFAFGASSLITHRDLDPVTLAETWRHAHGAFARLVPGWEPLVLLSEVDYVLSSSKDEFHQKGWVGYLQADLEFQQGMHLVLTGETSKYGAQTRYRSWGGWLSYAWFFAPHADIRLDLNQQSDGASTGRYGTTTLLLQGHLFL